MKDAFFRTPSAFIFLYEKQSFLAFRHNEVAVWNFAGEQIGAFDDHNLRFQVALSKCPLQ